MTYFWTLAQSPLSLLPIPADTVYFPISDYKGHNYKVVELFLIIDTSPFFDCSQQLSLENVILQVA